MLLPLLLPYLLFFFRWIEWKESPEGPGLKAKSRPPNPCPPIHYYVKPEFRIQVDIDRIWIQLSRRIGFLSKRNPDWNPALWSYSPQSLLSKYLHIDNNSWKVKTLVNRFDKKFNGYSIYRYINLDSCVQTKTRYGSLLWKKRPDPDPTKIPGSGRIQSSSQAQILKCGKE